MLDLARAAAGDKFVIIAEKVLILYWWDSCKFCLAMTSVIITYLVAFSATNMHIYHKVTIGHVRFALQCFSFSIVIRILTSNDYTILSHLANTYN